MGCQWNPRENSCQSFSFSPTVGEVCLFSSCRTLAAGFFFDNRTHINTSVVLMSRIRIESIRFSKVNVFLIQMSKSILLKLAVRHNFCQEI